MLSRFVRTFRATPGPIIFASSPHRGDRLQLFSMKPDGSQRRRLLTSDANDHSPSWSPDCSTIAFVTDRDGDERIWLLDTSTGETRRLSSGPGRDIDPAWSPDGKKIAFVNVRAGKPSIYTMLADGSELSRITDAGVVGRSPSWSRDGKHLVFSGHRDRDATRILLVCVADGTLAMATTETSDPRIEEWDPGWSPNGDQLAYSSNEHGPRSVCIQNAGGTVRRVYEGGTFSAWSPDSQSLLVTRDSAAGGGLLIVPLQGGGPRVLSRSYDVQGSWSQLG